jgi:hypothetical protein
MSTSQKENQALSALDGLQHMISASREVHSNQILTKTKVYIFSLSEITTYYREPHHFSTIR